MKKFNSREIYLLFVLILSISLITGCGGDSGNWLPGLTGTPPTVTAVAPLANATGVAINIKKITAAFSKAMDPATLTTASFTLQCPAGTAVAGGAVTYVTTGNVATLTLPAPNLPVNTICTATITTDAKDSTGIALASNYNWTFTTGALADAIAPTVITTVPSNAAAGVATNTLITAKFSEDMDPSTITPAATFTVANTTDATAVAGTVTYLVSSRTATFTPTTMPLLAAKLYTATITTAATDLAGNALAVNKVWTFTTGAAPSTSVLPGIAGTPGAAATNPTVTDTDPINGATNVATSSNSLNNVVTGRLLTATFSQVMDNLTINSAPAGTLLTFTLKQTVAGTDEPGTVAMNPERTIATFTPTAGALLANTDYTAKITTAAKNSVGTPMPNNVEWTFKTGALATGQAAVNLGLAGNYTAFGDTGVTNATAGAVITGDIGVGPGVTSTAITGFALVLPAGSAYATSSQVIGKVYAFDYAAPTPANVTTASNDMLIAYNDAKGRTPGVGAFLNRAGGNLGGLTLPPGVYTWGSAVTLPVGTNVTLDGGPDDVWIMQFHGFALTTGAGTSVLLSGGAQAKNVFWEGTGVTIGAGAQFEGVILSSTTINFGNVASANSRMLAQTAVNLDKNAITAP